MLTPQILPIDRELVLEKIPGDQDITANTITQIVQTATMNLVNNEKIDDIMISNGTHQWMSANIITNCRKELERDKFITCTPMDSNHSTVTYRLSYEGIKHKVIDYYSKHL